MAAHFFVDGLLDFSNGETSRFQAFCFGLKEPKPCHPLKPKNTVIRKLQPFVFFLQQSNKKDLWRLQIPCLICLKNPEGGTLGGGWKKNWVSDKHGRICLQAHHWFIEAINKKPSPGSPLRELLGTAHSQIPWFGPIRGLEARSH